MGLGKRPNRELARLLPHLDERFRSFVLRGADLVHTPVGEVLYGFAFDSRPGHGPSRWLHAFGLPLSVPYSFLSLSFGRRIPNDQARGHDARPVAIGTEAELRETALVMATEGMAELVRWSDVTAFRRTLTEPRRHFNVHFEHAAAVLAARQGDYNFAISTIENCEKYIRAYESRDLHAMREFNPDATDRGELRTWEREIFEKVLPLLGPCRRNDEKEVQTLLDAWRAYTISSLNVSDITLF